MPVFCFDPRICEQKDENFNTRKMDLARTKFILESVKCMRESLSLLGSALYVSHAHPEEFIPSLISKQDRRSTILVYQRAAYGEEKQIER